jgi:uncharacterized protein
MLHSYAFSNFRSFRERVEVSFVLTDQAAVNGWVRVSASGQRLSTALAVLGPNASGKTSLIQPLAFLGWFIKQSFSAPPNAAIAVMPHFTGKSAPTEFELIADGPEPESLWRYRLAVTERHVVAESLEQRVRRGRWRSIFERHRKDDDKYEVMQDGFGLDPQQASAVRPNVSLISWAAQFGVQLAQQATNFALVTNMHAGGRAWQGHIQNIDACARYYAENLELQARMRELLAQWDLGLSDVFITEHNVPDASGETKKNWFAFGVHHDRDEVRHLLPFAQESSGTKTAFTLLAHFLSVLSTGGVVAWDELEGDLHPHMLEPLLDLFSNPETNPKNAQIIFTCHAVEVMQLLQKSQIMLVEKDGLESHAWRLDSMEGVRSDDNRIAKYLAGAYGAVPRL